MSSWYGLVTIVFNFKQFCKPIQLLQMAFRRFSITLVCIFGRRGPIISLRLGNCVQNMLTFKKLPECMQWNEMKCRPAFLPFHSKCDWTKWSLTETMIKWVKHGPKTSTQIKWVVHELTYHSSCILGSLRDGVCKDKLGGFQRSSLLPMSADKKRHEYDYQNQMLRVVIFFTN